MRRSQWREMLAEWAASFGHAAGSATGAVLRLSTKREYHVDDMGDSIASLFQSSRGGGDT